ncbi:MAG: hypothetical protein V1799_06065 [bacterium]
MTTKPPLPAVEFPANSIEKIAYSIVEDIQTQEPNDRNRLGYSIWAWLVDRKGTLEQAITNAGTRTQVPHEELVRIVKTRLQEKGIQI